MHAASVHPEPGSNSRSIVLKRTLADAIQSVELDCSFTFCLSSILIKNCEICISHTASVSWSLLCTYLLVVQFSKTELAKASDHRFSRQPWYYITDFCICQYLFWNFFKNFLTVFGAARHCLAKVDCDYYTTFAKNVNLFLQKTCGFPFWLRQISCARPFCSKRQYRETRCIPRYYI